MQKKRLPGSNFDRGHLLNRTGPGETGEDELLAFLVNIQRHCGFVRNAKGYRKSSDIVRSEDLFTNCCFQVRSADISHESGKFGYAHDAQLSD